MFKIFNSFKFKNNLSIIIYNSYLTNNLKVFTKKGFGFIKIESYVIVQKNNNDNNFSFFILSKFTR